MATKKTSNKKDPLKSKNEWTISEFQMWLHGAFALQGDDWVPNAEQWALILDIIYKLKDRAVKQPARQVAPPVQDFSSLPPPPGPLLPPPGGLDSFIPPPLPPEANMSIEELRRRDSLGGVSNNNTLIGNNPPGEKVIRTGTFE